MFMRVSKGINDRLMSLCLPIQGKSHITIMTAYALTKTNPEKMKDNVYEELDALNTSVLHDDKFIILADCSTGPSPDHQVWDGVTGRNNVGKSNSNGIFLLGTCATNDKSHHQYLSMSPNMK